MVQPIEEQGAAARLGEQPAGIARVAEQVAFVAEGGHVRGAPGREHRLAAHARV